jgi:transcriptional regulator with XRE-family HTH domain
MTALGDAIRKLREERGWTQEELAAKVGMDRTNLARRENGKTRVKPTERPDFAKAFGMSLVEFDEQWRDWMVTRTNGAAGIPVINRAPAGLIMDYEEYGVDSGQGYEYIDFGAMSDRLAFAVVVVGDSMRPTLTEGDYLVLSPLDPYKPHADRLKNGAIVFVRFTNEHSGGCTLARFFEDGPPGSGKVRLQKDNPAFAPIVCNREDIQLLALAIERRVKLAV